MPKRYKRGKIALAALFIIAALVLASATAMERGHLSGLESGLRDALAPLKSGAMVVKEQFARIPQYFISKDELLKENLRLKSEVSQLENKVSSLTNEQLLKNTAVAAFMKSRGVTSVKEFAKTISKASGLHGIMEEYLEEVANYYMAGLADPANIKGPGNKEWRQQQLDTFLTVAAFSPIMKSADFAFKSTIGKNVHISGTYANGKKFDVKLPSNMYREIGNIFASTSGLLGEKESNQLDAILSKYGPKLNKEQLNLSLHLIQKLGQDKQAEIIAKSNASSLLDMTVEKPVDTDIEEAEKNIGRLTDLKRNAKPW